ncbi:MAG: hypothetical protein ACJASK_001774 [Ilumatobacter sp.]
MTSGADLAAEPNLAGIFDEFGVLWSGPGFADSTSGILPYATPRFWRTPTITGATRSNSPANREAWTETINEVLSKCDKKVTRIAVATSIEKLHQISHLTEPEIPPCDPCVLDTWKIDLQSLEAIISSFGGRLEGSFAVASDYFVKCDEEGWTADGERITILDPVTIASIATAFSVPVEGGIEPNTIASPYTFDEAESVVTFDGFPGPWHLPALMRLWSPQRRLSTEPKNDKGRASRPGLRSVTNCVQLPETTETALRPRWLPNCTTPSASAKSESSLALPTLMPGWKRVPRWRTMMAPVRMSSPPNTFTPRRCAFESRPLRVEPPPFVFDIKSQRPFSWEV